MTIIDLIRLIRKHIVLLILAPLMLSVLVVYLTRNPALTYSSETTLYTGIASGSSIEMDRSFSYFANNTAFDNLINVITSRETQKGVAIRLLAQHLMLKQADTRFLSKASYDDLHKITPKYIYKLIENKSGKSDLQVENKDTSQISQINDTAIKFSFDQLSTEKVFPITIPPSINKDDFERTVKNLEDYMASSDTNFVYKLLYYDHPHYSIKAISSVNVQRIASSDLVKIKFNSDDPGICQQTLAFLTEVCIKNYRLIKENRSDAVVKYFEHQLKQAAERLKIGEDKLLSFNEDNNIINYYEQSKAVAIVKEDIEVDYNNKRIKLAGLKAGIQRIEEKLQIQQAIQLKSTGILETRNKLNELNSAITEAELKTANGKKDESDLTKLKVEAEKTKDLIRKQVQELYTYGNSIDGLPVNALLNDWITNVIEYEATKAGLDVLGERIKEFQKQYAVYAPAGATIKRIEREISVSEQEFLEILHGLNLAKLKLQDAELSATIKAVDSPFFPLAPNPTKRKILVLAAAFIGFLLVMGIILAMEYFDDTLRNAAKAQKRLKLNVIGVFPKILLKTGSLNFPFVVNRLLEIILQNINFHVKTNENNAPQLITIVSTLNTEGKTVIATNLSRKIQSLDKKILYLNYSAESLRQAELKQLGFPSHVTLKNNTAPKKYKPMRFRLLSKLFGYDDNRIDTESPFLYSPSNLITSDSYIEYQADKHFEQAENYTDLYEKSVSGVDYIILELPSLLYHNFPLSILTNSTLTLLVSRSNRIWTEADEGVLETLKKACRTEPLVVLNGVDMQAVESILGDLPKKRSRLRRIVKNLVRLQFFSRQVP